MVSRWWYAVSIGYLVSSWRALSMSTSVFWLVQSCLLLLSCLLPRCLFFCPKVWCLTFSFPSLFVRLLACSLLGWGVSMFLRPMSLLEVRMSCRLVSSSMFQCYPWRCRGAWRMLSIRPWSFFESPCLVLWLSFCISVPGRCSFQRSRSQCCWHTLVHRVLLLPLSSTCSSSDPDFHFHQLIPKAFVVAHVVY